MIPFINFLNSLSPLDENAIECLNKEIKCKTFKKGALILNSGRVCNYLFFTESGLVKLFFHKDEKEFVMRFFSENTVFTSLDSYLTKKESEYSIVALEPTTVYYISQPAMEMLCKKYHSMESCFRKFVSMAALNMMHRISEMLEEDATKRYHNFMQQNGPLIQRISLGDIASYLGITQVSLSRIRARR